MSGMRYQRDDWPHGLRCIDCDREFIDGQPIAERLEAMTYVGGEPATIVEIVCFECSLHVREQS